MNTACYTPNMIATSIAELELLLTNLKDPHQQALLDKAIHSYHTWLQDQDVTCPPIYLFGRVAETGKVVWAAARRINGYCPQEQLFELAKPTSIALHGTMLCGTVELTYQGNITITVQLAAKLDEEDKQLCADLGHLHVSTFETISC